MRYRKYFILLLPTIFLFAFIPATKHRKTIAIAPFGHVKSIREVTYNAIGDTGGTITKGDIMSDTDINTHAKAPMVRRMSGPPIEIWLYDENGNEIENDRCHADGRLFYKEINQYNADGLLLERDDTESHKKGLESYASTKYSYMPDGKLLQSYMVTYSSNSAPTWYKREAYTYNHSSQPLTFVVTDSSALQHSYNKTTYIYGRNDELLETFHFNDDFVNPASMTLYRYDDRGKLIEQDDASREQKDGRSDLLPTSKEIMTYDKRGRVVDKSTYIPHNILVSRRKTTFDSSGRTDETSTYQANTGLLQKTVVKRQFKATHTIQEDTYDDNGMLTDYTISHFDSAKNLTDRGVFHITYKTVRGDDGRYHNEAPGDTVMIHHLVNDDNSNTVVDDSFQNDGKIKTEKTFQYTYDNTRNWISKIVFISNKPVKIIERDITYYP